MSAVNSKASDDGGKNEVECVRISVWIGGSKVDALLDSCASVSLVSLKLANKFRFSIEKNVSTNIVSIFGSSTSVVGKTTFNVRIGSRTYLCKALVLQDSLYPILLGLDWLFTNRCKLNFDKLRLEFPSGLWDPITVKKEKHRAMPVRSKLRTSLEMGERALIPVVIPDLLKMNEIDGIIIGLDTEQPWKLAKALVKVLNGKTFVEITNLGGGPWTIGKKQQLGWFEFEPSVANAVLVSLAMEMEDVPSKEDEVTKVHNATSSRLPMAMSIGNACKQTGLNSTKGVRSLSLQQRDLSCALSNGIKKNTRCNEKAEHLFNGRTDNKPNTHAGTRRKVALVLNTSTQGEHQLDDDELEKIIGHLPQEKKIQLRRLLMQYRGIFALNNNQPGTTNAIRHDIDTGNAQPISQPPYRTNPEKRKEIQRQVQSLLDAGQIESSKSPWSSPVLLVPKKDGGWRMCVDYRKVNAVTKKVSYPIPRTEDTFDYLLQAKWFSKMDAASGFWQVPMEHASKEKTAMITPDGLYHWKVMPFGLCNAPATFQRLMDAVLNGLKWKECLVYLDDILIFSKDWESHLMHLRHVFDRLEKARISLKLSKCEFAKNEIQFLGHIVKEQKLLPDERNTEAVVNFPVPKDLSGIRGFLGLVGHYRRFIPRFAEESNALRKLLKKGEQFHWGSEQQTAFNKLKDIITSKPVLGLPDFSKPFRLSTDASNIGISAILSQIDETGKELYVIGYRSRALRGSETNYSTIEKEMLAIVFGLQKFDYYLMGSPLAFEIVTDHQPLCNLPTTRDPYGRVGRWALLLQSYNYKIRHLPGQQNVVADVLSRFFAQEEGTPGNDEIQQRLQELVFVNALRIEDSLEEDESIIPKWLEQDCNVSNQHQCMTAIVENKKDWFYHWKLNPKVFNLIEEQWGPFHTDLFATEQNRQLDKYYSKDDEPLSAGTDSFKQVWEVEGCYANPPWSLLDKTVRRIREERLKVVLISPYWPNMDWFKMALKMCACPPILLGRHEKLYLMHEGKSRGAARWSSIA